MEQKKTLWIIAAVGVFLLVVLGGGLIAFRQTKASVSTVTKNSPIEKKGPEGWAPAPEPQGLPYQNNGFTTTNDMVVLSENTKIYGFNSESVNESKDMIQAPGYENTEAPAAPTVPSSQTIDLNDLRREAATGLQPQPSNQNINISINLPESGIKPADNYVTVQAPVSVSSEYYTQEVESKNVSRMNPPAKAPAEAVDAPKAADKAVPPAAKAEPKAPSAPKTAAAPKAAATASKNTAAASTPKASASAAKPVTRYWVQVAAYSNKNTAENARSILTEKKITSDIYTYQDAKEKLYYRVRIGPFTTKSEAEYWKAKIGEIKDFANAGSYVTSTTD